MSYRAAMPALKYLNGYDERTLDRVRELIAQDRLGTVLRERYGEAHAVRNDKALFEYTIELKDRFMRKSDPLGKVIYDNRLHVVRDGLQALAFLRNEGEYADAPRPGLILLDLTLPKLDGHEVLAVIKEDADLRRIPVVVLTTSEAEEDILRSYQLHANAFVTKPVDFDSFVGAIRQIDDFFITVVARPS